MPIKIESPKLTPLNSKVLYSPEINIPAATIMKTGNATYKVFAICYIPTEELLGKPISDYNKAIYRNGGNEFIPSQSIALKGGGDTVTVVLSYFDNINIDVDETIKSGMTKEIKGTSRTFSLGYDFVPKKSGNQVVPYECNVYALEFYYTIEDYSTNSRDFLFFTQTDIDPEIARGIVVVGSDPE